MTDEQFDTEILRDRGITCNGIKSLERKKMQLAKVERQDGFNNLANADEQAVQNLKAFRKKFCLLK